VVTVREVGTGWWTQLSCYQTNFFIKYNEKMSMCAVGLPFGKRWVWDGGHNLHATERTFSLNITKIISIWAVGSLQGERRVRGCKYKLHATK
jgi:hypothetical protein